MDVLKQLADLFLHLDSHLADIISNYGAWTYAILFLIIFSETGFVVTPFLPGDSLLFAAGTFAGIGALRIEIFIPLLIFAAVCGNSSNYFIGYKIGARLLANENSRIFKKAYINKTHEFYEKYGKKTIVMAQFVPIVRTFAPFLAGVGKMNYFHFITFNITGAVLWVSICSLAGYFFGALEVVQKNFSLAILAVIFISILPGVFEYLKHLRARSRRTA